MENNNIVDVNEVDFETKVLQESSKRLVVVDFWAPWCGPCKTLGPALENAVKAANGKVKMVKIDVDQSQQIAAQLQIKSIPTVYGFFEGKPVDAFQGAQSESEIKKFIMRIDNSAKIKFLTGTNPFKSNKSNFYLTELSKSKKLITKRKAKFLSSIGVSDGRYFADDNVNIIAELFEEWKRCITENLESQPE